MFDNSQFFSGAKGFYPLTIDQSLRFNDDDSAYLSRTPASAGNQKTFTISFWLKMGLIPTSASMNILGTGTNNTEDFMVGMSYDAGRLCRLMVLSRQSSSVVAQVETSAQFRDPSAWYHFVISVDTTQATSSNRIKIYVNGVHQTSLNIATYPSQNLDFRFNSANVHRIGTTRDDQTSTNMFDGYLAEVHFVDGTAYTADDFGELKSGVWVAKSPSVTYGTNGFHLDFANSADIGNDISGNGNDWTPNNFTASDVVLDSPTDNYATLNPLKSGMTLSDGNLRATASTVYSCVLGTIGVKTGKWYWEVTPQTTVGSNSVGVGDEFTDATTYLGKANDFGYAGIGQIYGPNDTTTQSGLATYGAGDVIGVAMNMDDGEVKFYKNNVLAATVSSLSTESTWFPVVSDSSNASNPDYIVNFGQLGFTYTPPTGYLALSTANLPDPVIDPAQDESPSDYFNTVLYTGNGGTQSITVGFQPDWVWAKGRSVAYPHFLADALRTNETNNYGLLQTNSTGAEDTSSLGYYTSLDSDGFTLGGSGGLNLSGNTFVAWNWKANGSGVTNTDGSITSTVSANTTSGFSIITYTGNGTAGATIGHGLNQAPEIAFHKVRNQANQWHVGGTYIGNWTQHIHLDLTNAAVSSSEWNSTTPSSSVITLGSGSGTNWNTNTFVCYAFHSVDGYSKIGSYVGNGSATGDGAFIYLGFRPKFFLVKSSTVATGWFIWDSETNTFNVMTKYLEANSSASEGTYTGVDFVSNGIKLRSTSSADGFNQNGQTYIYMAFAENPFKYSNAR